MKHFCDFSWSCSGTVTSSSVSHLHVVNGLTIKKSVACDILSAPRTEHDNFFQPFVSSAKQLCPGVVIFLFPLCNSFSCEARNNLAQSMKVNALEGAMVEDPSGGFSCFTALHQYAQVSVFEST